MSYDVAVAGKDCPCCGASGGVEIGNYTYNCSPMLWEANKASLSDLNGKPVEEVALVLSEGVAIMRADPERFRAMNPANGWGDYDSWLGYLDRIIDACNQYPGAVLVVT